MLHNTQGYQLRCNWNRDGIKGLMRLLSDWWRPVFWSPAADSAPFATPLTCVCGAFHTRPPDLWLALLSHYVHGFAFSSDRFGLKRGVCWNLRNFQRLSLNCDCLLIHTDLYSYNPEVQKIYQLLKFPSIRIKCSLPVKLRQKWILQNIKNSIYVSTLR